MNGFNHVTSSVIACAGLCVGLYTNPGVLEISAFPDFALFCVLGSAIPDIDNKNSSIGRMAFILRPWQGEGDHRSRITHKPIFAIITSICLWYYFHSMPASIGWLVGYILHLLMDTMTAAGINWFYPFNRNFISLRSSKSGGFGDFFIMIFVSSVVYIVLQKIGQIPGGIFTL